MTTGGGKIRRIVLFTGSIEGKKEVFTKVARKVKQEPV